MSMQVTKRILTSTLIILLILTGISTAGSSDSAEISVDKGLYNENAILLKNAQFDTSIPQPAVASAEILSISQYPGDVEGYYIVQFSGYIREEWKQAVSDTGAVIFDYVPNNAFVVRMKPAEKSLVELLDKVQWIGIYQPSYRISPALSSAISTAAGISAVTQEGNGGEEAACEDIIILLFDAHDNERVLSRIENLDGEIVDNAGDIMRVRIDGSKIPDIAIINGVSWIEKYVQPVILNDVAANITNVYEVRNTHGLTGSGQIVAVADTGLDTGVDDASIHDDIEGRIVQIFDGVGDGASDVCSGHGTHVSGSVLGNGTLSGGKYKGMAPQAQLVFQAIGNTTDVLFFPSNLTTLFQQAYNKGARIHTNSWGSDDYYGDYLLCSRETDIFMWEHPDMLILFAAGNEGPEDNTVTPPSTAKNAIAVGATQSSRFGGDIDAMASFSSRGFTDDGRTKPDVVAPGTNIYSTKSCLTEGTGDYVRMSGTSMATPLTAGTVALIRQYYVENESIISPSAALLKATLINGAADMGLSSNEQGWGRVDIEQSLFPASPQIMRYHDNIRLDASESWNVTYCLNNLIFRQYI
ncbi:MAG: Subtilisin-like serine protease [ANME-2 cluster archaeon]|nr:Subtilisin-like serine protease [ANME-2 cluster archaeon]